MYLPLTHRALLHHTHSHLPQTIKGKGYAKTVSVAAFRHYLTSGYNFQQEAVKRAELELSADFSHFSHAPIRDTGAKEIHYGAQEAEGNVMDASEADLDMMWRRVYSRIASNTRDWPNPGIDGGAPFISQVFEGEAFCHVTEFLSALEPVGVNEESMGVEVRLLVKALGASLDGKRGEVDLVLFGQKLAQVEAFKQKQAEEASQSTPADFNDDADAERNLGFLDLTSGSDAEDTEADENNEDRDDKLEEEEGLSWGSNDPSQTSVEMKDSEQDNTDANDMLDEMLDDLVTADFPASTSSQTVQPPYAESTSAVSERSHLDFSFGGPDLYLVRKETEANFNFSSTAFASSPRAAVWATQMANTLPPDWCK